MPFFHVLSRKHPYLARFLGIFAVPGATALWGIEGVPVRVGCSSGLTPLMLAFRRAFFSALILAMYVLVKGRVDLLVPQRSELPHVSSGAVGQVTEWSRLNLRVSG